MTGYLTRLAFAATIAASFLLGIRPASAHHVMGGKLPQTAWEGLLSGLGHPIIGPDHFAFIVGVGLLSQLAGRLVLLPILFLLGTIAGCYLHVQGVNLPWPEAAVVITVVAVAVIVVLHHQIPAGVLAILFAASGILHGYAYGESIVGAETAPLLAYFIGLAAVQCALALAVGAAFGSIVEKGYVSQARFMRIAGGGIALCATVAFANVILGS